MGAETTDLFLTHAGGCSRCSLEQNLEQTRIVVVQR